MSKQFWIFLAAGLAVVALGVAGALYWTRGAHIELKGAIQKVRLQEMDERSAVAVIDFRFVNPSDHFFWVRTVTVTLEDARGNLLEGRVSSEPDAQRLFQFYPLLGQKFNDTLRARDKIASRQSLDRMVAVRFEVPESVLAARKNLRIVIEDVDGAVSEIAEKP
ncbi:MAG: hypothetical protein HY822_16560 [Acidobacteria bacterium]|nr:hypothetical protein [Acidobacteriota bacterium]